MRNDDNVLARFLYSKYTGQSCIFGRGLVKCTLGKRRCSAHFLAISRARLTFTERQRKIWGTKAAETWSAAQCLSSDRGACDIQSVISGSIRGRWCFVFLAPSSIPHATGSLLLVNPFFLRRPAAFPLTLLLLYMGLR